MESKKKTLTSFGGLDPRADKVLRGSDCWVLPAAPDAGEPMKYGCGHIEMPYFEILLYGEHIALSHDFFEHRIRCGNCELQRLQMTSIRCAICSFAIQEYSLVRLYRHQENSRAPDYATIVHVATQQGVKTRVVGCTRESCHLRDKQPPVAMFFCGRVYPIRVQLNNPLEVLPLIQVPMQKAI